MQLNVNRTTVMAMAARLRRTLGVEAVTQSLSLEAVASALIGKNWDTLSGMLKSEAQPTPPSAKLALNKPVSLYVPVFSTAEYGESPSWACISLDDDFLEMLNHRKDLCLREKLGFIAADYYVENWDSEFDNSIEFEDLYISKFGFWVRAVPKHTSDAFETRMISIEELLDTLASKTNGKCLKWEKDVLIYTTDGNTKSLLEVLVNSDELPEEYLSA